MTARTSVRSRDEVLARLEELTDEPTVRHRANQPDLRDGSVYRCPPTLLMAVRVALVTGRPLLLYGWPGSGKSSVAAYLARNLGWSYYEYVVTARTEAQDLLWRFDLVRRLGDAQIRDGAQIRDVDYVEPGVLWWALNPESARRRGATRNEAPPRIPAIDHCHDLNKDRDPECAVVLLDELDKADPDVPSSLLVPLGSLRFTVTETGAEVEPAQIEPDEGGDQLRRLVIITTNEERDLSAAFVRRCIVHQLKPSGVDVLVDIAYRHLRAEGRQVNETQAARIRTLAEHLVDLRPDDPSPDERVPSTAEYLDAVRAALELGDRLTDSDWQLVEQLTLTKDLGERA